MFIETVGAKLHRLDYVYIYIFIHRDSKLLEKKRSSHVYPRHIVGTTASHCTIGGQF